MSYEVRLEVIYSYWMFLVSHRSHLHNHDVIGSPCALLVSQTLGMQA